MPRSTGRELRSGPTPPGAARAPAALSIRSNALWSLVGNAGFAACQLGVLSAIARLGTTELLGRYALGLAISAPIFLLFSLQLRTILAASLADDDALDAYLAVRLLTAAIALVATAIIAWVAAAPHAAWVVVAVGASKAIDALHDVPYGAFWRHNRMDFIAKSMLLRGASSLAAFAVTLWQTTSLVASILAMAGAWLVVLLSHDLRASYALGYGAGRRRMRPRWSTGAARQMLWLGLPGGVLSWLTSLQLNVPRYFVQTILGESDLGVLSALAYLFVGAEMAVRSFNYAAMPRMAQLIDGADAAGLRRLTTRLTLLGSGIAMALIAGAAVVGRPMIGLLFGAAYAEHARVFLILSTGFAVRTATMPTAMSLRAVNAYWSLTAVQMMALAALSATCAWLVPHYGLEGCAVACVVGFVVDGVGRAILHASLVRRTEVKRLAPCVQARSKMAA